MKTFKTCLLPVIFFGSALMLSACGGGGGDSSPTSTVGVGGTNAPSVTFNVSNSQVLVTTSQLSSLASGSGAPGLLKNFFKSENLITFYESDKVGNVTKATTTNPLTNFYSIDASGNIVQAVTGAGNIKVMYTVASPDGAYVYIALDPLDGDTRKLIAQQNCAIFKVTLADNTFACLDTGFVAQGVSDWTANYSKKVGKSVKPIQLDSSGNVYYLGRKFDASGDSIFLDDTAPPAMRKVTTAGVGSSITPDVLEIQSFIVTKDGLVVYAYYDALNNKAGIKMYDPGTNSTNEATPASLTLYSQWNDLFYMVDDKETLIFGAKNWYWDSGDQTQGIYFTQRSVAYPGGKYKVKFSTKQFGGGGSWVPPPVKVLTDGVGNLYGLFVNWRATGEKYTPSGGTPQDVQGAFTDVYQLLPYDPVRKAAFKAAGDSTINLDWWGAMNGVDVQINNGYAYALEKESYSVDVYSSRMIIKAVNMSTKKEIKMLSGGSWTAERYDIYNWKLVGNKLHFSGFNNANSTMILGEIDTAYLRQNGACPTTTCLTIKTISSVAGAAAQIQDMEAVTSQTSTTNTGQPKATFYTDPENIYSASVRFDKPMNKSSVNDGVSVTPSNPSPGVMKVWLDQTLHLIADTNGETSTTTVPFSYGASYNIALSGSVLDTSGQALDCTPPALCSATLTTRPARGWWQGTGSTVTGITDGTIGKFALIAPAQQWWATNMMKLVKAADNVSAPGLRLEFSALNKTYGYVQISLKGNTATPGCAPTLYIYSGGAYLAYNSATTAGYSWCGTWKSTWDNPNVSGQALFNGQWAKYVVEFNGANISLTATSEDGTSAQYLSATDADLTTGFTGYTMEVTLSGSVDGNTGAGDLYLFDNVTVSTLSGVTATPIFNEDFATANLVVPTFDGTEAPDNRLGYICDYYGLNCNSY